MTTSADETRQEEIRSLRETVGRREVCWEVFAERVAEADKPRAIGFELELSGIHTPADRKPLPGCDLCKEVFEDLKRVAVWILPQEHRASVYEIAPYEAAIRSSSRRQRRQEVSLSIRILHGHHYGDPVDRCEQRCLREMEERLKQLGACPGEWKPVSLREGSGQPGA